MLRRYDNRIDPNGRSAVVFYRNLRFPVGAEIFQQTRLSHFRQSLRQTMRKHNGKRHIFFRFAARIAEHQALISRAEQIVLAAARFMFAGSIHAERDICGLTVDQFEDAASIVCESAEIVTDLFDHLTRGLLVIDVPVKNNVLYAAQHSTAERAFSSARRSSSKMVSAIVSQTLSGCPSVTLSLVKKRLIFHFLF